MSTKGLIVAACRKGDLPQLKRVLEGTQFDVGSEPLGSEGETALHIACAHGHLDIVWYLIIKRGCCFTLPDLNVASYSRHWRVMELLLSTAKEDIHAEPGELCEEAFYESCEHGYKILTMKTALVVSKQQLQYGLFIACSFGQLEIALYLTNEKGCDPTLVDPAGVSPLQQAWNSKHWRVASCLVQAIQERDSHCAGRLSHTASTQFLEIASFGEESFHVACSQGFLEALHFLHEYLKCSLVQLNSQGETPLTIARSNGHLLIIQYPLKNMTCTESDLTEMHVACIVGDEKRVRILSRNITCLRAADKYGMTPVHYACCEPATLKVLVSVIEHNDLELLHMQDGKGNTPLHYAVITGCMDVVKTIFLNCDCNPNIPNNEGCTPLHVAVIRKECEIAVILLNFSQCNPNIQDQNGNTPLHMAINRMSLSNIKPFLNHDKIDLNIKNMQGNTPLHEAVMGETSVDVVEALTLHKSYNPNIMNEEGMTPLQVSIIFGKMHYVEVLVTSEKYSHMHEDIVRTMEGTLLLHHAVYSNRSKLVTKLLKVQEYDVNKTNSAGETALHLVSRTAYSKFMLEELVEDSRCDLNAQDQHGNTALHLAVLCTSDAVERVQCILQSERCNPNITNSEGHTPLHVAVKKRHFEIAVILLGHSQCNPNIQDLTGNTPLHMAISKISLSKVESFLDHKNINLNTQNRKGNTPLHEAVVRQVPVNVVEALTLHKSCNPSIANNVEMTPLKISVTFGILDYAEVLITSGKCSYKDIVKATKGTLLHQAVSSNRHKLVLGLIAMQEYNVNAVNSSGETALHIAFRTSYNTATLEKLIEDRRCDLNAQDQHGNTALHLAVYSAYRIAEKVQCILQYILQSERCNPNITNSEGNAALHMAIGNISLSGVESFLNHKSINLNIQNREGNIPLHTAVVRQVPVDVVETLTLHKSCNPSIANNEGMTPLQISVTSGRLDYAEVLITSGKCYHKDIVKATEGTLLLHQAMLSNRHKLFLELIAMQECKMNVTNSSGETAFHTACRTNYNTAILEKLVEDSRCDLNAQDQQGNTALHLAVYSGSDVAEKVQCILQSERCNPNITNSEGYTPLHVAVIRKQYEAAVYLLNHSQCDPNIQDLSGYTPLHMAVGKLSLLNIEPFLMHKRITIDIQNREGNTPLHEAVVKEVPLNVMEALVLHKNCNPNVANFDGLTPLQMAVDSQQMDKVAVLFTSKKCEDIMIVTEKSSLLFSAAHSDNLELLTASLRAGVDINTSNSKGETALHIACKEGNTKATKLLLQNEANLLAVDRIGNAPIHVACAYMQFECLDLLLGYHVCNPNQRNVVGETPLHMLCSNGKTCDMRMLHTLLSTPGINPECANHLGQTPAELADSNYSVIKMISKCLEHRNTQLETYLKIFVVGNSGGGKSTLIKAVTTERSKSFKYFF